jgi:hypothetical protein
VAQGLTVVLPRRPRRVALRIPHTWAAILPPAAFLATVAGLAMHPSLALAVVAVACVGVPRSAPSPSPPSPAAGARRARCSCSRCSCSPRCTSASPGELAVLTLVMLSCVALGSLLAACAGVRELVVAACSWPRWTSCSCTRAASASPRAALLDARLGHMPDFAQPVLGRMTIGYGDFFVAALAGAIAARRPSRQTLVAPGHHRLRPGAVRAVERRRPAAGDGARRRGHARRGDGQPPAPPARRPRPRLPAT